MNLKNNRRRVVTGKRSPLLTTPRGPALAAISACAIALVGTATSPPSAAAEQAEQAVSVGTLENSCHEIRIPRAANLENLDALVPPGYVLARNAAGNAFFYFIDYSCKQVFVDEEHPERMTASWVVAALSEPSGVYILAHVTNSQALAARYSGLGLPTRYEPDTTSSYDAGEPTLAHWDIAGDGVAHTVDVETSEPPETSIVTSTANFFFETDDGHHLRLTYDNVTRPSVNAVVTADFTRATDFTDVFALPRLRTPTRVTFSKAFTQGGWTGTLQRLD